MSPPRCSRPRRIERLARRKGQAGIGFLKLRDAISQHPRRSDYRMNKVPAGKTIAYAYAFTFGHLGTIIGLAWLPLVISAVLQFLPYALGAESAGASANATAQGRQALEGLATALLIVLLNAIIFVPVVRQALGLRQGAAVVHFKLGAAEFRLFGAILLLLLVTFVLAVGLRLLEFGLGLVTPGRGAAIGIVADCARDIPRICLRHRAARFSYPAGYSRRRADQPRSRLDCYKGEFLANICSRAGDRHSHRDRLRVGSSRHYRARPSICGVACRSGCPSARSQ